MWSPFVSDRAQQSLGLAGAYSSVAKVKREDAQADRAEISPSLKAAIEEAGGYAVLAASVAGKEPDLA